MGLFDLFGKKEKVQPPQEDRGMDEAEEFHIYSGMRVEVTTEAGQILFVAKLLGLRGDKAELHQYSESELLQDAGSIRARIRGYSDHERRAVYMEGVITPGPKHIWQVEELTVVRIGNDRAFFRLDTDLPATVTMFSGLAIGERPCRLLGAPISRGGQVPPKGQVAGGQAGIRHVLPGAAGHRGKRGAVHIWVPLPGADRGGPEEDHPEHLCRPTAEKAGLLTLEGPVGGGP